MDELENEARKFPRGKHDDVIDTLQMLYSLYEIQPNTNAFTPRIKMEWDQFGRPICVSSESQDRLK